jgi:hypothetical protein
MSNPISSQRRSKNTTVGTAAAKTVIKARATPRWVRGPSRINVALRVGSACRRDAVCEPTKPSMYRYPIGSTVYA